MLERFRAENKGCLFAYSVEVDEAEAAGKGGTKGKGGQPAHKQAVQEMIHNIEVAADFEDRHLPAGSSKGRRTWVAIKLVNLPKETPVFIIDIYRRPLLFQDTSP